MDHSCIYYRRISQRSVAHFLAGLLPRLRMWCRYELARRKARRRGARIGRDSIIIGQLARRANRNLTVGDDTSIGSYKLDLRSPVKIGSHVIISNVSEIITTSHCIDSPEWEHKHYGIEIEDYVWIASNALILPSCRRIGRGAVIGAGAVVVRDVPPMCVMSGNPAKVLKQRKCVHDKLVIPSLLSGDLKLYWKVWMAGKKY